MKGEFFRPCPKCGKICNAELDMCEICSGKIAKPELPKPIIPVVTPVVEPIVEEVAPVVEEQVATEEVIEEVATEENIVEETTNEEKQEEVVVPVIETKAPKGKGAKGLYALVAVLMLIIVALVVVIMQDRQPTVAVGNTTLPSNTTSTTSAQETESTTEITTGTTAENAGETLAPVTTTKKAQNTNKETTTKKNTSSSTKETTTKNNTGHSIKETTTKKTVTTTTKKYDTNYKCPDDVHNENVEIIFPKQIETYIAYSWDRFTETHYVIDVEMVNYEIIHNPYCFGDKYIENDAYKVVVEFKVGKRVKIKEHYNAAPDYNYRELRSTTKEEVEKDYELYDFLHVYANLYYKQNGESKMITEQLGNETGGARLRFREGDTIKMHCWLETGGERDVQAERIIVGGEELL